MDPGTTPKPRASALVGAARGKVMPKVSVEEQMVPAEVPAGSRFKGYEDYVRAGPGAAGAGHPLSPRALDHAGWPDGDCAIAAGVTGHFGPELRRFVLAQYHQGSLPPRRRGSRCRGWWRNCRRSASAFRSGK